jgi:glycosyltransferase involved in cell wall biosynthesis
MSNHSLRDPERTPRRLVVEGWRFIPHSYALVNQCHLLQMLDRPGLSVWHRDTPYFNPQWQPTAGVLDSASEQRLKQIPTPAADQPADALFRITFPYNLAPSGMPTFVFGTAEAGAVPPSFIAGNIPLAQALESSEAVIVTPSHWSARGFLRGGADARRVHVVPHGVDPAIFRPVDEEAARQARAPGFTFLHVGAMTGSKNVPLLLKAFALLLRSHPECWLVLKGSDDLYQSADLVRSALATLSESELERVQPRLRYVGGLLACAQMAALYHLTDCYVAPYAAEGFNLPVLEAAACGLPVICTRGGPTDDFTNDDFALRIDSTMKDVTFPGGVAGQVLEPDLDHLLACMVKVTENAAFRASARQAGPRLAHTEFTWQRAVDKLLAVIFPS